MEWWPFGIGLKAGTTMGAAKAGVELGRVLAALVAASFRHRLWFRLEIWVGGLAVAVLAFVVSVAVAAPWFVSVALLGPVIVVVAGVAPREWTLRKSKRPLLALICRFAPSSYGARDASYDHRLRLQEVIEDSPGLSDLIDVRKLEPLTRKQAAVVLNESGARATVYGEVRVEGGHWMVKGGLLLDPPPAASETGGSRGHAPPPDHRLLLDRDRPLRELVSSAMPGHIQMVRAELLKIAVMLGG
jgi:hypothetical protein